MDSTSQDLLFGVISASNLSKLLCTICRKLVLSTFCECVFFPRPVIEEELQVAKRFEELVFDEQHEVFEMSLRPKPMPNDRLRRVLSISCCKRKFMRRSRDFENRLTGKWSHILKKRPVIVKKKLSRSHLFGWKDVRNTRSCPILAWRQRW